VSPFRPVVVRTRRISVVLVTLAALALPIAAYQIGTRVNNNCESIHRVVQAGVRILNTPANLRRAYAAGKITTAEYRASLAQIHRFDPLRRQNVADWRKADCQP
jgi:hypothetical protein